MILSNHCLIYGAPVNQFLSTQQVPQINDPVLSNYLGMYLELYKKYPQAGSRLIYPEDKIQAFDPPTLHAWETEKITQAMRNSRLEDLFVKIAKGQSLSKSERAELNRDSATIKYYLDKLP